MTEVTLPISRHFTPSENRYDAIIIGAGMSGMAAAIRLGMYDKRVLLLEKHTITGGLNSYYGRGKRQFDVGLHALTNFAVKKERGKPLTKLLKQLRIPYDELLLEEQKYSQISFPNTTLKFTNNISDLISEISEKFPHEVDGFKKLISYIEDFNEVALDNPYTPAKVVVRGFIKNNDLLEMIFCPLLIYGSAWENDMDFSQFAIMFKSIFLEGFGRTSGGVRKIIQLLLNKMEEANVETCFRNGVKQILTKNGKAVGVETTRGDVIHSPLILSCAGLPETLSLLDLHHGEKPRSLPRTGKLSFTETILITNTKPKELNFDPTIVFYNNRPYYKYQKPEELIDQKSAVLCFPNNFKKDDYNEGVYRLTMMANYDKWKDLKQSEGSVYKDQKEAVYLEGIKLLKKMIPGFSEDQVLFKDVFTPTSVERYTGHFGGCVYGSPDKSRDGTTSINGLYVCGTDQGFLGIIGSMLSGISIANLYGLMGQSTTAQTTSENHL